MNPFQRLALFAAASAVCAAVVVFGAFTSVVAALCVSVGGAVLAYLVTLEHDDRAADAPTPPPDGGEPFTVRRRDRADIERAGFHDGHRQDG